MVTKKSTPKKVGEWTSETLAEWSDTEHRAVWRAQKSTSPDGKDLIGVRQYIKTAKYEGPGRNGITVPLDDNAEEALTQIMNLFRDARTHLTSSGKSPVKAKVISKKTALASVEPQFYLKKNNGKYLVSVSPETGAKVSSDQSKAQLFTKSRASDILDGILSDAWSMYAHTE